MDNKTLASLIAAAGIFLLSYAFLTPGIQLLAAAIGGAMVAIGWKFGTDID